MAEGTHVSEHSPPKYSTPHHHYGPFSEVVAETTARNMDNSVLLGSLSLEHFMAM